MTFVSARHIGRRYLPNAQIELRNFPTPYADGDMGDGHADRDRARKHAARTAATLAYPSSGNISASKGTVMAWVWVDGNDTSTRTQEAIFDAGTSWPYCALYMSNGTTPTLIMGSASGNASATGPAASGVRQWVHVAATWTGSTMTVYTNGVAGTPRQLHPTPRRCTRPSVSGICPPSAIGN